MLGGVAEQVIGEKFPGRQIHGQWTAELTHEDDSVRSSPEQEGETMAEQSTSSVVISADPAAIMAVIADFEAYPDWASGVKRTTVLEPGDGATDDGGRARSVNPRSTPSPSKTPTPSATPGTGTPRSIGRWSTAA